MGGWVDVCPCSPYSPGSEGTQGMHLSRHHRLLASTISCIWFFSRIVHHGLEAWCQYCPRNCQKAIKSLSRREVHALGKGQGLCGHTPPSPMPPSSPLTPSSQIKAGDQLQMILADHLNSTFQDLAQHIPTWQDGHRRCDKDAGLSAKVSDMQGRLAGEKTA